MCSQLSSEQGCCFVPTIECILHRLPVWGCPSLHDFLQAQLIQGSSPPSAHMLVPVESNDHVSVVRLGRQHFFSLEGSPPDYRHGEAAFSSDRIDVEEKNIRKDGTTMTDPLYAVQKRVCSGCSKMSGQLAGGCLRCLSRISSGPCSCSAVCTMAFISFSCILWGGTMTRVRGE